MTSKAAVYFPGLNGIRAIAALGVLVSHVLQGVNHLGLPHHDATQFGGTGVTIFFTLSGFLITFLLLQEREQFQRVNLKQFYLRRVLRIWPLYFTYLLLVIVILGFGGDGRYLILFVLFLPNIAFNLDHAPNATAHLWTIGVEEQFYAFWPIVVARVRRLVPFLLGLIAVLVAARFALKLYSDQVGNKIPYSVAACMRFDCMATGALFAIAYKQSNRLVLKISCSVLAPLAFWGVVILAFASRLSFLSVLSNNVIAVATGFFILSQIEATRRWTLLENPVMSLLGQISFGIYVYHPLVVESLGAVLTRFGRTMPNVPIAVMVTMALTVTVAWLSYHLLEQPFLKLKQRFSPVVSRTTASAT